MRFLGIAEPPQKLNTVFLRPFTVIERPLDPNAEPKRSRPLLGHFAVAAEIVGSLIRLTGVEGELCGFDQRGRQARIQFERLAEVAAGAIIAVGRELARSASGGHVLVHCHAGVSRSTAATAILLARESPGREAEAFRTVARLRPGAWPNGRMIDLADALLARQGRLTAGLREMQEARMGGRPRSFWRF